MTKLGPSIRERWPMGVVSIGFWVLAWVSFGGAGPQFVDPLFWVGASSCVATIVTHNFVRPGRAIRSLSVSSVLLFGLIRTIDYVLRDVWAAMGVWLIIGGLTMQLSRTARSLRAARGIVDG